jgi:hypothetical protein
MKLEGKKFDELEVGNAWDDLYQAGSQTNWLIGATKSIPSDSLRFMQQDDPEKEIEGTIAKNVAVKWFVHKTTDPAEWGVKKPTSKGRTVSLLAGEGKFELVFSKGSIECR